MAITLPGHRSFLFHAYFLDTLLMGGQSQCRRSELSVFIYFTCITCLQTLPVASHGMYPSKRNPQHQHSGGIQLVLMHVYHNNKRSVNFVGQWFEMERSNAVQGLHDG